MTHKRLRQLLIASHLHIYFPNVIQTRYPFQYKHLWFIKLLCPNGMSHNFKYTRKWLYAVYSHRRMILFELLILNPNISPQKCVSFVNEKSFRKTKATIWNIQDDGSSKKRKRIYVIYVVNIKMKKKVGNSNNRQQEINNLGFFI